MDGRQPALARPGYPESSYKLTMCTAAEILRFPVVADNDDLDLNVPLRGSTQSPAELRRIADP